LRRLLFLFIILVALSASALSQLTVKEDQKLRDLVKKLTDAQTNYDQKTLDAIFTPDYIEISPAGEFDERAKVLGFYAPELKPDASRMTAAVKTADFNFRYYGDVAVVIVRVNYSMTSGGKELPPRSIRATLVCKREKGEWKIASAQYTGIRPPPPPKAS
jgi:uncharacterized protein (TIGR02246 family)